MKNLTNVIIRETLLNQLFEWAALVYPRESCALLFGEKSERNVEIKKAFSVRNMKRSEQMFSISQGDLRSVLRKSEHNMLGIFHSHRYDTRPSAFDLKNMVKKDIIWLIGQYKPNYCKSTHFKVDAYIMVKDAIQKLNIVRKR